MDSTTHRFSKHYKYHDPLPIIRLTEYFTENKFLKIKGKDLDANIKFIKHDLEILEYDKKDKKLGDYKPITPN